MSSRPEDERVKIPALVHMTRLGYRYIQWTKQRRDEDTNIFASQRAAPSWGGYSVLKR